MLRIINAYAGADVRVGGNFAVPGEPSAKLIKVIPGLFNASLSFLQYPGTDHVRYVQMTLPVQWFRAPWYWPVVIIPT